MAVEKRQAWIVSDKINFGHRIPRHAKRVLHKARHRLFADLGYLEGVAVRMHGMNVAAIVVHHQPVAPALLHREKRIGVGP